MKICSSKLRKNEEYENKVKILPKKATSHYLTVARCRHRRAGATLVGRRRSKKPEKAIRGAVGAAEPPVAASLFMAPALAGLFRRGAPTHGHCAPNRPALMSCPGSSKRPSPPPSPPPAAVPAPDDHGIVPGAHPAGSPSRPGPRAGVPPEGALGSTSSAAAVKRGACCFCSTAAAAASSAAAAAATAAEGACCPSAHRWAEARGKEDAGHKDAGS